MTTRFESPTVATLSSSNAVPSLMTFSLAIRFLQDEIEISGHSQPCATGATLSVADPSQCTIFRSSTQIE